VDKSEWALLVGMAMNTAAEIALQLR